MAVCIEFPAFSSTKLFFVVRYFVPHVQFTRPVNGLTNLHPSTTLWFLTAVLSRSLAWL